MMTSKTMIKYAKYLVEKRTTKYVNSFPYNLGYCYDDKSISFDCWNLIKSLIWTDGKIAKNVTPGTHAPVNTSTGLGDWDGQTMYNNCPQRAASMSKDINIGELILTANMGHAGLYIGNYTYNGHVYNVIECNEIDGLEGVIYSYVDITTGKRYRYKGGNYWGTWKYHAIMPWIKYNTGRDTETETTTTTTTTTTETIDATKIKTYKTVKGVVNAIKRGEFGNGTTRKNTLYKYFQNLVDKS